MSHPFSHKCPIPISQLCLVNTDMPAGVGAPPLDTQLPVPAPQRTPCRGWPPQQRLGSPSPHLLIEVPSKTEVGGLRHISSRSAICSGEREVMSPSVSSSLSLSPMTETASPTGTSVASEAYYDWSGEATGARLRVNFTLKLLLSQNFCNRP